MLCIIGAGGNMGRRYSAICQLEKIAFTPIDKNDPLPRNGDHTHFLITTPTDTHLKILDSLVANNINRMSILIEKPLVNSLCLAELIAALKKARRLGHSVYMVNQYAYYSHGIADSEGPTYYDYYNSGKDGIFWDCIQLLYLARNGVPFLKNKSPIWHCMINGVKLDRELIDLCYLKMLKDFITDGDTYGRHWYERDIIKAHKSVIEYEINLNRHSSPFNFDEIA